MQVATSAMQTTGSSAGTAPAGTQLIQLAGTTGGQPIQLQALGGKILTTAGGAGGTTAFFAPMTTANAGIVRNFFLKIFIKN